MIGLKKDIENSIARDTDNIFWCQLLECMYNSINQLSLENNFFLSFIGFFEIIDDENNTIHWGMDFSKCFYDLIYLCRDKLKVLYKFIEYVESNATDDIIALCQNEIFRGKKDVKWLIDLDCFYQNLINNFSQIRKLSRHEIISSSLKDSFPDQEKYFISLLHNRDWYNLSKNEILSILRGYDFQYLSDKAYCFVLLACIKICIDIFRENGDLPPEEICFFLKNKERASNAELEIRKLLKDFIQLLSYGSDGFLAFNSDDSDKLMKIWATN